MNNTIDFDPGFSELVQDFNNFINDIYSQLMNFQSMSQKRAKFRVYNNKIYSEMENNIAFYQGCLLWAYLIKQNNAGNPKNIKGNTFLNLTKQQLEDYDFLMIVNFMENYFESYERDTLYYTGKKSSIPQYWIDILNLYKEFLELNKGFINTKKTSDIVLPKKLASKEFKEDINNLIQNAIKEKDLKQLLRVSI